MHVVKYSFIGDLCLKNPQVYIYYNSKLYNNKVHAIFQLFSYPSISPVNAFSGVISPTTLSLISSPVATPRTTPRSTPIPRWTTPFGIPLDDNMDYNNMLATMMHVNPDEPLMNEGMIYL